MYWRGRECYGWVDFFVSLNCVMLCVCDSLFASISKKVFVTLFRAGMSKGEPSSQLNGLFTRDGVHGTFDGKDYQYINMVFPSICAYMDKAIRYFEDTDESEQDVFRTPV